MGILTSQQKGKLIVLAIVIFLVVSAVIKIRSYAGKIFVPDSLANNRPENILTNDIKKGTPFNILLLGYGGGNHDGAYLTDSMIVAHIEPSSKKLVLISIPRDIWIKIPTNGNSGSYWKINAAYELGLDDSDYPHKQDQFKGVSGAGNMAKYAVSQVTGLTIDKFLALDFNGFKKSIDTLGGVDINVETTFDDYEYPIDGKENDLCGHNQSELPDLEKIATVSATEAFPCRYENLHFDAGPQHMDGERALKYVRSRHSLQDGTDFGRSKRQRNLIQAVKDKIFNIGFIPKIVPFITSLSDDLTTDISPGDVNFLVNSSNQFNGYKILNLALTDQNVLSASFSDDGQYILEPKNGLDAWGDVHNWLLSSLNSNSLSSNPIIKVENGTNIAGLAALASNRLQDKDYFVLPPSNSDNKSQTKTQITVYNNKIDQKFIDGLKQEFNVDNVTYSQSNDLSEDVLIVVGQDYNQIQGKKIINE